MSPFARLLPTFLLIFFFNVKSYFIILGAALLAVIVYFAEKKFGKKDGKKSLKDKADSDD